MTLSTRRLFGGGVFVVLALAAILGWQIIVAQGATYTWDNGGGDGLWSTCTNWTSNTCPGASDIARFNPGTSDTSSTIDGAYAGSVGGILVESGFTGTITQARSLTIGSSGVEMYGGTFTGASQSITATGASIVLENATFTSTSDTLSVNTIQFGTGATFNHNSGTVLFNPAFIGGFFAVSAITLNNVTINPSGDEVDVGSYGSVPTTLTVLGTLTLTNGDVGTDLTINAQGPVVHGAAFDGGTGSILVTAGAGDISAVTGGSFPAFTLSTARSLVMTAGTVTFDGDVTIEDGGTFTGSTGTTQINGSLIVSSGSTFNATTGNTFVGSVTTSFLDPDVFTISSGATFNANGGTIEIGYKRDMTINVNTSLTLANLNIDTFSDSYGVTISSGDTLVVTGQLLLDEGYINGGIIETQGTLSQQTTFGASSSCGSTVIHVTAAIAVTPPLNPSDYACFSGLNLDNAGASYTGAGTGNFNSFGGDVTINAGTFNATDAITYLATDAGFDKNGGTFNNDGGTFEFQGGTQYIYGGPTFNDLNIYSDDMTFESSTTTVINGDFNMYSAYSIMTVHSSSVGVQAELDFNGSTYSFYSLDVQDNEWVNASSASCLYQCTSSGNNTNWTFDKNIVVTNISGTTTEAGGTATFTVVLDQGPDANVTIGVTSSDLTEGTVSTALLTFTTIDWATPQTITATGVDDVADDEGVDFTIVLAAATSTDTAYSGLNPRDITVRNLDNDETADNIDYDFPTDYTEQTAPKTDLDGQVATLTEADFIATTQSVPITFGGTGDIVYNSADDSIWFGGDAGDIYEYVIDTDTLTSHTSDGTATATYYLTYDNEVTRSRVWMTNDADSEIIAFTNSGAIFGTFPTNSGPNRILFVNANDADAANDSIWLGNLNGASLQALTKYNAATGAPYITDLATSTFALTAINNSFSTVTSVAYDTGNNAIWATTLNDSSQTILVGLNQTTGAPLNGTLGNSTYTISPINPTDMEYDSFNDYLWIMGDQTVIAIDPDTGSVMDMFDIPDAADPDYQSSGIIVDTVNNILIIDEIHGNLYRYDIADGYFLDTYTASVGAGDIVFDAERDIWVLEAEISEPDSFNSIGAFAIEEVQFGVTANNYYTVLTNTGAVVDSSSWTDLSAVTVTETLDSANIYYSFSFGAGTTYAVYNSGWRSIASSLTSVHGGTDGVWYYRNNASSWSAASTNNAQTAISQAVAAGVNNQMSGTATSALTGANLVAAGGWSVSIDEVRVGATFYSTSYLNNPAVDNILFTTTASAEEGGGSSTPATYVLNPAITAPACTANLAIIITLSGQNAYEYIVSDTADFLDVTWLPFVDNGNGVMDTTHSLSVGDGQKNIFAKFRSNTEQQSATVSTTTTLDSVNSCSTEGSSNGDTSDDTTGGDTAEPGQDISSGEPTEELTFIGCEGLPMDPISVEVQNTYRLGVSPMSGDYFPTSAILPGDFVRSETFDTVYCITKERNRRAFMDETTFFTQTRTFSPVKWVADETLTEFPLSYPMLPRQGVTFLKFESDPRIYHFIQNPQDPNRGILRWVTTEELTKFIAGDNWSDFVIDLNPTLIDRFDFAAPYLVMDDILAADIDVNNFRARTLLNERSAQAIENSISSPLLDQIRALLEASDMFLTQTLTKLRVMLTR
jgi:hypothetical protein